MSIIDDLVTVSKSRFLYDEKDTSKLGEYYQKVIDENRLIYLINGKEVVGYIIYFIFDEEGIKKCINKGEGFDYPVHNPEGAYLYIDENVVFKGKKANYLYLRKLFKKEYPLLKKVFWHNILKNDKVFSYSEDKK